MTDLQLLFLVLAVIYGWECACWLRRGSVGFLTWFGQGWRVTHPGMLLGNQKGGFVFANPLPPLGTVLIGNQFPLSLSAHGLLAYVSTSINPAGRPLQSGKLIAFDDVKSVASSGRSIKVNGEFLLKAASPGFARDLAQKLRQLAKVPSAKRNGAIQSLVDSIFDAREAEKRWQQFQKISGRVRLVANSLFAYLFIFAPALIWNFGFSQCWLRLLIGLVAFTTVISILFLRVHRELYPAADDERFTHFLTILLSPATAIRAQDILSRPLLENFHPLTIAKVVCAREKFEQFVTEILRETRHPALPICPVPDGRAAEIEQSWREMLLKGMERFCREAGLDLEQLSRGPAPGDATCRSYCPRCLAQFTVPSGHCVDCGGLETVSFKTSSKVKQPEACKKP